MSDPDFYAPFWDHVEELRDTVIRILLCVLSGMIFSFFFYGKIIAFLTSPLSGLALFNGESSKLILLGPLDGMAIAFKTSLWVGTATTSPFWMWLLFRFVSPALQQNEKMALTLFFFFSLTFFALGAAFAFYVTIPLSNLLFSNFNTEIGQNMWSLGHYLDYTLFLLLANGLAFEAAVIGLFSVHLGLIGAKGLVKHRRKAILGAFVLAALLTPPDVVTQVILAIPLIVLYEGLIIYSLVKRRKGAKI